jgi:hypothetical protein
MIHVKVLVVLFVLFFLSTASAFTISAPEVIDVHNNETFFVEVTNTTNQLQELNVAFFSPAETTISAPKNLSPNSTAKVKVTLNYSPKNYTEVLSKLEVKLGTGLEYKEILVRFYSDGTQPQQNPLAGDFFAGLFGLTFFFQESLGYSALEWALFIVLVIVAAILLVAFIARASKRRK